jgi:hypothetical protein
LLLAVLGGVVASAGLMALLYQPDADPSRIYYGTDTRAAGLLIGAALAFVWLPVAPRVQRSRPTLARSLLPDLAGLCALGALICFFAALDENQPFLYQGGFVATALATAAVIAAAVHPSARLVPGLLGVGLLRWIGLRSYGIYLWHWPVYAVTRPQLDVPLDGPPLFALRLALTFALAELSYRLIEMPVRSGALGRAWQTVRHSTGPQGLRLRMRYAGVALAGVALAVVLGTSVVRATPPALPSYLSISEVRTSDSASLPPADEQPSQPTIEEQPAAPVQVAPPAIGTTAPIPTTTEQSTQPTVQVAASVPDDPGPPAQEPSTQPPAETQSQETQPQETQPQETQPQPAEPLAQPEQVQAPTEVPVAAEPPPDQQAEGAPEQAESSGEPAASLFLPADEPVQQPTMTGTVRIFAIGDSVMIGAATELRKTFPKIDIDAVQGRQISAGIKTLRARHDSGRLGDVVVVHLGNNGYFSTKQFDDMMRALADVPRVVFLNDKVQRRWEGSNNDIIAAGVQRYPNAVLVDWRGATINHPEYFWKDGIHVRPAGARAYAALVASAANK